jgi:hypothetical protein
MRFFIYLFNKQKDKEYVKDIQVEIKFHFLKKTVQFEGKYILVSLSYATIILDRFIEGNRPF